MDPTGLEPVPHTCKVRVLPIITTGHFNILIIFILSYGGFEPTSEWLTATYFTIKLVRFLFDWKGLEPLTFYV